MATEFSMDSFKDDIKRDKSSLLKTLSMVHVGAIFQNC